MTKWAIIANEYPPKSGGVSEYARLVARGLVRCGDEVHVWVPADSSPYLTDPGVSIHTLPDHFGLRGLAALESGIARLGPCRIFLQYVPNAFGWRALHFPFCFWLLRRRKSPVWVMFHEVAFPWRGPFSVKGNALAAATRLTAALVAHAAQRAFITIPFWETMLKPLAPRSLPITWLPVPSYAAATADPPAAAEHRKRIAPDADSVVIGHYCTDNRLSLEQMTLLLPDLLRRDRRRVALLVGRGSRELADRLSSASSDIADRVRATGVLPLDEIAAHLAAGDVLVQPYPDGVSGRRTTAMAGLALGLPIVTTEGFLTEPLWRESAAVVLVPPGDPAATQAAVESLLGDEARRKELGARAAALYAERFSLDKTIEKLRAAEPAAS